MVLWILCSIHQKAQPAVVLFLNVSEDGTRAYTNGASDPFTTPRLL